MTDWYTVSYNSVGSPGSTSTLLVRASNVGAALRRVSKRVNAAAGEQGRGPVRIAVEWQPHPLMVLDSPRMSIKEARERARYLKKQGFHVRILKNPSGSYDVHKSEARVCSG